MRNLETVLREEGNQNPLTLLERDYVQTNRTRQEKMPRVAKRLVNHYDGIIIHMMDVITPSVDTYAKK